MKNSKIFFALFFTIFLNAYLAKAEQDPLKAKESKMVLATSGLNLRQGPSLKSAVVKLVGYGEQVEILENNESLRDTILINRKNELIGNWVKVSHRGLQGYMFSSFLAKVNPDNFPTELLDQDFALLYAGCNCFDNFQFRRDFVWTGIYKTASGKYRSKKVNPSYHFKKGPIEDYICVETNEVEEQILFMVGSRDQEINAFYGQMGKAYDNFHTNSGLNENVFFDGEEIKLSYCHNNIEYSLNHEDYYPMKIAWKGDLDNDGIEDFIIQHGDKDGRMVLYLSSQAENGKLFKKVAEYKIGYCC